MVAYSAPKDQLAVFYRLPDGPRDIWKRKILYRYNEPFVQNDLVDLETALDQIIREKGIGEGPCGTIYIVVTTHDGQTFTTRREIIHARERTIDFYFYNHVVENQNWWIW